MLWSRFLPKCECGIKGLYGRYMISSSMALFLGGMLYAGVNVDRATDCARVLCKLISENRVNDIVYIYL